MNMHEVAARAAPALPSVAVPAAEFRALTVYERAPPGCFSHLLTHDRFAPHLAAGEAAVVDPDDREPVTGEMFVVRIETPRSASGYVEKLVQLRKRAYRSPAVGSFDGWMMHFSLIRSYGRRLGARASCSTIARATASSASASADTETAPLLAPRSS